MTPVEGMCPYGLYLPSGPNKLKLFESCTITTLTTTGCESGACIGKQNKETCQVAQIYENKGLLPSEKFQAVRELLRDGCSGTVLNKIDRSI